MNRPRKLGMQPNRSKRLRINLVIALYLKRVGLRAKVGPTRLEGPPLTEEELRRWLARWVAEPLDRAIAAIVPEWPPQPDPGSTGSSDAVDFSFDRQNGPVQTSKEKAPKEVWAFADGEDPDQWVGGYPSREEAIAEAEYCFGDDSEIWVQRGELVPTSELLPDVDDIIQRFKENAYEYIGENDFISVSQAGAKELEDMIIAWADRHIGDTGAWRGVGKPEKVESGPTRSTIRTQKSKSRTVQG